MGKLILTGYVDAKSQCARQRNYASLGDIHRYLTGEWKVSPATSVYEHHLTTTTLLSTLPDSSVQNCPGGFVYISTGLVYQRQKSLTIMIPCFLGVIIVNL